MKKYILGVCAFLLILLSTSVFAQSTNWADYGLTEEDVQYLSQEEKDAIMKVPTPSQTKENIKNIENSDDSAVTPIPTPYGAMAPSAVSPNASEIQSCFDLYTFGSVQADMTSQSSGAVAGMNMDFFGNIENTNAYPIVEGTLYVKIFRKTEKNGDEKNPNGDNVVDQFVALDNLTIPANGTIPAEFSWKVPAYAQTGDYQLVTFFTTDKKFNLLGLSFTDDVVGNTFDFEVDGVSSGMSFDKSSVTINDAPYYFAAYPPRIEEGNEARVSIALDNTTDETRVSVINWSLYRWDAMNPDNLVRSFTSEVSVGAKSSQTIELNIPESADPVYYLVGEVQYEDTKSIVGIRFVREGVDKVRLNFPSVTSYPLVKGQEVTMFTCIHNSGTSSDVPNNKVTLEIKDHRGRTIESYTYEGIVTGEMMALKKAFTSRVNLDVFSLHASVYTDGKLVDESVTTYDCKLINPDSCQKDGLKNILSFAAVVVVLLIAVFLIKKYLTRSSLVLPLLMLCSFGLLIGPSDGEARSLSWNKVESKDFAYFWNNDEISGSGSGWALGLRNPNITVNYDVEIKNLSTGAVIADGDLVPVGTKLRLKFGRHHTEDISWFGTGYSGDSPFGQWKDEAAPPAEDRCKEKDFVGRINYLGNSSLRFSVFIPLVVDYPRKAITNKENLKCEALVGDETTGYTMDCVVSGIGPIKPSFDFGTTKGKFYYQYKFLTDYRDREGECISNSVPMKIGQDVDEYWTFDSDDVTAYALSVPAKSIRYSFKGIPDPATLSNVPPTAPLISGPTTGFVGANLTYSVVSTDADNDQIKYGIDWNSNGTVDQWLPSTGFVNSGTAKSSAKAWSTLGLVSFKAIAQDARGLLSTWSTYSTTLTPQPINGACSTLIDQCSPGSTYAPDQDSDTHEKWMCVGSNGGTTASCSALIGDPNRAPVLSCSVAPNPATRNQTVTYTASMTGGTYKWFVGRTATGTPLSGEDDYIYSTSYPSIGSYNRTVQMVKDSKTYTAICNTLTVGCGTRPADGVCGPGDVSRTVYGSCQSDGTYARTTESCTPGTDPKATFYFSPNIVASGGQCKLYLEAQNVTQCSLVNRSGNSVWSGTADATSKRLSIVGQAVDIGTHTLRCTTADAVTTKVFDTKSCVSSPDIKEN